MEKQSLLMCIIVDTELEMIFNIFKCDDWSLTQQVLVYIKKTHLIVFAKG